jgi:hypothetical protein
MKNVLILFTTLSFVLIESLFAFQPGDVNNDGSIDLMDAILSLQVISGKTQSSFLKEIDVNDDDKIGIEESIYALQWTAGLVHETGTLSITLDYANSVSTEITPAGGTLFTTSSDGKLYTLTFPPDALNEVQEIVLTPITHIEGLPIGTSVLAGVHATPSGLQLLNPATLTIEPLPPLNAGTFPVGLLVEDDG